jgi:hypothetical protein
LTNEDNARLSMVREVVGVSADRLPNSISVGDALLPLDAIGLGDPKQRE